ncbi:MAG: fimbrillin family protein [Prevotella sp.]|nr:fimbrillin family protein [Prevotella sp.]
MKKKKIFALMAAALSLAACSTNDVADITHDDADNVVNVASATRNANASAEDMTAPFHLINITQRTKNSVNFEADFTHNGSAYTPTDGKKVVWYNGTDANGNEIENEFEAFSPLTTPYNLASYSYFHLPTDQSTADLLASADWMTADTRMKKSIAENGAISLNFEHQMSKLHFDVIAKDDAQSLTSQDFSVLSLVTPYYDASAYTVEAIIDPKREISSAAPIITIKTAGNETLSVPIPSGITFAPGKQYNFNLTLGHHSLSISSVSVTEWTSVDVSTGKEDEVWTDAGDDGIDYITFTAEERQGFNFEQFEGDQEDVSGFEYSVGNGEWKSIPDDGLNEQVPFGGYLGTLRLRGINPQGTNGARTVWFSKGYVNVKCSGDIRTLIDYRHYKTVDTGSAKFSNLFLNCTKLISAPKLPSTKLAEGCYWNMFYGCSSLTNAPVLPATTLSNVCYQSMFTGCKSLTNAPALPAPTLAESCYQSMFDGCTALETAPVLPATTLADYCYSNMFNGCSNLSSVTMLATDVSGIFCLYNWLYDAGTSATSRTLKLKNSSVYNTIKDDTWKLPDIWKQGADGTTITYDEE